MTDATPPVIMCETPMASSGSMKSPTRSGSVTADRLPPAGDGLPRGEVVVVKPLLGLVGWSTQGTLPEQTVGRGRRGW
jgi:hypothetical protein